MDAKGNAKPLDPELVKRLEEGGPDEILKVQAELLDQGRVMIPEDRRDLLRAPRRERRRWFREEVKRIRRETAKAKGRAMAETAAANGVEVTHL